MAQLIDSLAPGGAEHSLVALAPELQRRGIEVEIAHLGRDATLALRLLDSGVPVRELGRHGGGRIVNVRRVMRWLRSTRPDLLHTTLFEADQAGRIAASLSHTRVVSSLVNVSYGDEHLSDPGVRRSRLRAAQALDTITARRVVRFHAITAVVADTMAPRLRIPRHKIDVIHRGRSAAELGRRSPDRAADVRRRLGVPADATFVVAAARHEHQKGLDVLLRAVPAIAHRVPGLVVAIAGRKGNATTQLEQLIAQLELGDLVRLLGARDDVPDLLAAADAFVLPSRWEGLGSVVIEAMALEAPIVASDLPAVREVLGDDRALLVPSAHAQLLADAVLTTLTARSDTARRTASARHRFIASFEISAIADATATFYERALARQPLA